MRISPTGKEAQCVSARVRMHIPTSVASMISHSMVSISSCCVCLWDLCQTRRPLAQESVLREQMGKDIEETEAEQELLKEALAMAT